MKTSDLFIKTLEKEGVEYIFRIPGEENLDLEVCLSTLGPGLILTHRQLMHSLELCL